MSTTRYWCFDEPMLTAALDAYVKRQSAQGRMTPIIVIREFLSSQEAIDHKLIVEVFELETE